MLTQNWPCIGIPSIINVSSLPILIKGGCAYKEYFVSVANTSNIILKINEFIMLLKKSYNHHCMQGNNFIALKMNKLKEIIQIYPPFPIQTLCQSNQILDEGSFPSQENFS